MKRDLVATKKEPKTKKAVLTVIAAILLVQRACRASPTGVFLNGTDCQKNCAPWVKHYRCFNNKCVHDSLGKFPSEAACETVRAFDGGGGEVMVVVVVVVVVVAVVLSRASKRECARLLWSLVQNQGPGA